MKPIAIYDPAMCCSSGVCGVDSDPQLSRFAADLKRLADAGADVRRFGLAHEPEAFVTNPVVCKLLDEGGSAALPAVVVDGILVSQGRYPSLAELAAWIGWEPESETTPPAPATTCCSGSGCR